MAISGYVGYRRREYCKHVACPIQALLDKAARTPSAPGSVDYDTIRAICVSDCIHTTYEFHHWLIQKGYLVVRPGE